jgi:exosortase/archaeosortase family protein
MAKKSQKKKILKDVIVFLLKFNVLLIPFYAIIYFDVDFYPLQIAFANFLASILRLMKYRASTSGFFLFIGEEEYPIDISRDCIGWKSAYSLFALVFATPGLMKDKLKFLSVWVPVLFVVNVLRTLMTILIGLNFGFQYIEIVHTFLWQEVMIVVLILVWYIWLKKGSLIRKK